MKIKDTFYILLAGLLPWGVMGCASQKMGDKVRVTPSDQVLMPDSTHAVQLDMTVEVPQKTLGKRSRLIIVPQLLAGDSLVAECTPMVLDAPIYGKRCTDGFFWKIMLIPWQVMPVRCKRKNRLRLLILSE